MSVASKIRNTVRDIKDWVISDLIKQQKPELDKKLDAMLKPPKLRNQIKVKILKIGKSIGRPMKRIGAGLSLLKRLL